jgi:MSHA pilin protein MshD
MRYNRDGFTLIEMVVLIVVLGVGLTGVTLVINQTVTQAPKALVQTRAMALAQAYLDEILQKRYDQTSGQGGIPRCDSSDNLAVACSASLGPDSVSPLGLETRGSYNDVDDYNGVDDQPPIDATGSAFPNYSGYRVQVSVSYAGSELGYANNRAAKRITVNVTTPLGNVIPVSAYRVNF